MVRSRYRRHHVLSIGNSIGITSDRSFCINKSHQRFIGFKPEFIFISAGFDAHVLDDMSDIELVDNDYKWITEELMKIAHIHAKGRVLSMLEGGYVPDVLARSAVAHIKALMD